VPAARRAPRAEAAQAEALAAEGGELISSPPLRALLLSAILLDSGNLTGATVRRRARRRRHTELTAPARGE
jgi:hypothetical protein